MRSKPPEVLFLFSQQLRSRMKMPKITRKTATRKTAAGKSAISPISWTVVKSLPGGVDQLDARLFSTTRAIASARCFR